MKKRWRWLLFQTGRHERTNGVPARFSFSPTFCPSPSGNRDIWSLGDVPWYILSLCSPGKKKYENNFWLHTKEYLCVHEPRASIERHRNSLWCHVWTNWPVVNRGELHPQKIFKKWILNSGALYPFCFTLWYTGGLWFSYIKNKKKIHFFLLFFLEGAKLVYLMDSLRHH